jgi:putative ABC transport system permease protein
MNWLGQIVAVTGVTIRSIPQRLGSSIVAIIGIGGVIIVFTAVLSIAEGFRAAMRGTGDPQTVIVLRAGSDTEMTSGLSGETARLITEVPGVERGDDGVHASRELFVIIAVPLKRSGTDANVPLRGLTPAALAVRPQLRIAEGRMFTPGTNEIVVGRAASRQFENLAVGSTVRSGKTSWNVVGIFDAQGSVAESELWCDASVLQGAYQRGNSFQSVYMRLESADAFQRVKDALTTDPRLNVTVIREPDYYAQQSQVLQSVIRNVGFSIAILMALGAIFVAINTMYSAVANRTREIATLRALGFGRVPVVLSVMAEAALLAIIGGMLGGGLAWLAFDGYQTATMNWQSFSQVAFAFAVTPALLGQGLVFAVGIGLLAALFPAFRAARLPVVTALRQL